MRICVNDLEGATVCGEDGRLSDVWCHVWWNPDALYSIRISTLADGEGLIEMPVKSIGQIGRQFFYALDHRFLSFPSAVCMAPPMSERILSLEVEQLPGGWRGSVSFEELLFVKTPFRQSREDVVGELATWAARQGERFVVPEELRVEAKKSVEGTLVA